MSLTSYQQAVLQEMGIPVWITKDAYTELKQEDQAKQNNANAAQRNVAAAEAAFDNRTALQQQSSTDMIATFRIGASDPAAQAYRVGEFDTAMASHACVVILDNMQNAGRPAWEMLARLQQALRGFAENAGLTVRGSQLMSVADQSASPEGFLILTVELRMSGMPSALDEFLGDVYAHNPLLKVAELNMVKVRDRRTSRRRDQPQSTVTQDLDINIQVSALMVSA